MTSHCNIFLPKTAVINSDNAIPANHAKDADTFLGTSIIKKAIIEIDLFSKLSR